MTSIVFETSPSRPVRYGLVLLRRNEFADYGCYLVGFGVEGEVSGVEYVDLSAVARERSTAACGSKEAVPFQGGEFLRKL
jgi:hypothetical protein